MFERLRNRPLGVVAPADVRDDFDDVRKRLPRPDIRVALSSSSSSRAASVSRAPSSASSRAITSPSPRQPPVITTDLPPKS
jgi:hypothetical protein